MKYQDGTVLSLPEAKELEALRAPLTLDAASTFDNSALSRVLARESGALLYIEPTALALARSPVWRLMCEELFSTVSDPERFRLAFLLASARLFVAGCEAEQSDND